MPTQTNDDLPATRTGTQTYTIDPGHSKVSFRIAYFGIGHVSGAFHRCAGTVRMDAAGMDSPDLSTLRVAAQIEADSIDTGNRERDRKLRGADLFDVKTFPHLVFESTGARRVDGNAFELAGDLTVRGITRNVVLGGHFDGSGRDDDGVAWADFSAAVTLLRSDYAVRWGDVLEAGGALIGDRVDVVLHVRAVANEIADEVAQEAG